MMFKIIHEGQVIDVVRNPSFIKFLSSGHIAITDKASAKGIVGSNNKTVYSFEPIEDQNIVVVSIENITAKEFNRLQSLLNSEQKVSADEAALAHVKETIIKDLSDICKCKITAGFSVKLLDGKVYDFKLTTEDQLNLLNLENQLHAGEKVFVYHATSLPCRIFMREDIIKLIKAYRKHVLYHTTYFNSAKQYINSLTDINTIKAFSYGTDITSTVKEPLLRQILRDGGAN